MSLIRQPVAYDSSMRTVYAEHMITGASKPDKTFPVTRGAGLAQASPVECVRHGGYDSPSWHRPERRGTFLVTVSRRKPTDYAGVHHVQGAVGEGQRSGCQ